MNIEKILFVKHFKSRNDMNQRYIDLMYTLRGILSKQDVLDADSGFSRFVSEDKFGPFETKDDVIEFAQTLSVRYKLHGVCLCDEEAINKALQDVRQVSKLNEFLFEHAEVIENPTPKKKGIFSSILGD